MAYTQVAYGLRLAASLPIPGLSAADDSGPVDVRIWLNDNPPFSLEPPVSPAELLYTSPNTNARGEPVLAVRMLARGAYFGFFYSDGTRFAIERDGREAWMDWPENYAFEDATTYLLGPVLGFILRLRGITCLHASAIAVGGQAVAVVGFPGAGKSTTAAAFARCGYCVLSDDVVALIDRGDHFLVPPGYPRVNLWPDSVRALFGFEDALPCISPTWDKRYLALGENGHRFERKSLPLGAIYVLDGRSNSLTPQIEDFAGTQAFLALMTNTYVNYLLDRDMRQRDFDVLSRVAAGIPVRLVSPPGDPARLPELCEAISSDALRLMAGSSASQVGHVHD